MLFRGIRQNRFSFRRAFLFCAGFSVFQPNLNAANRDPENPADVIHGMAYAYYENTSPWSQIPDFDALTPASSGTIS